jgi:hypothetical protein
MSNPKTSTVLTEAEARLVGLKAVDPSLDFGKERSVATLEEKIEQLRSKLADHNAALIAIDASTLEIKALEKELSSLSSQMLKGVEFEFGQNSPEYELIGGVPTDERLRRARQTLLKNASEKESKSTSEKAD